MQNTETINVTYQELAQALKLLHFKNEKTSDTLIYSYPKFNAIIKLRLPKSPEDLVQGGILQGHAFILQEKGILKKADALIWCC